MLKTLLRAFLKVLFRIELSGDPSVFINERTLIVANHESFLDGLLIGLMMPVDAVFVVHSQMPGGHCLPSCCASSSIWRWIRRVRWR